MVDVQTSEWDAKDHSWKNQKYENGEQLKVKIHILFYGDKS
jgi:hypothetical protein